MCVLIFYESLVHLHLDFMCFYVISTMSYQVTLLVNKHTHTHIKYTTFSSPSSFRLMTSRSKSVLKPLVRLKVILPVRPSQWAWRVRAVDRDRECQRRHSTISIKSTSPLSNMPLMSVFKTKQSKSENKYAVSIPPCFTHCFSLYSLL